MAEGQNTTNPDAQDLTLSYQQLAAVDLLALGHTITDTAEALGIARQTVSEWKNSHCGFIAALNSRRHELWEAMTDKIRSLLPKALQVLESELDGGKDPMGAAVHLLKAAGIYNLPLPTGPLTIEEAKIDKQFKNQEWFMKAVGVGLGKAKQEKT